MDQVWPSVSGNPMFFEHWRIYLGTNQPWIPSAAIHSITMEEELLEHYFWFWSTARSMRVFLVDHQWYSHDFRFKGLVSYLRPNQLRWIGSDSSRWFAIVFRPGSAYLMVVPWNVVPVFTPVALAESLLRMLEVGGGWASESSSEYLMPLAKMKSPRRTVDENNECSIVGNSML